MSTTKESKKDNKSSVHSPVAPNDTSRKNDPWENATPKTYLFGLIRGLKEEVEEIEDPSLRGYLLGYIERIETWEPEITDYDWY